jgi:transposase
VLEQLVEQYNDATLEELRDLLEQKTGVRIGRSTVDRMLTKLDLTVKKNTASHRKRKRPSAEATSRVLASGAGHFGKEPNLH